MRNKEIKALIGLDEFKAIRKSLQYFRASVSNLSYKDRSSVRYEVRKGELYGIMEWRHPDVKDPLRWVWKAYDVKQAVSVPKRPCTFGSVLSILTRTEEGYSTIWSKSIIDTQHEIFGDSFEVNGETFPASMQGEWGIVINAFCRDGKVIVRSKRFVNEELKKSNTVELDYKYILVISPFLHFQKGDIVNRENWQNWLPTTVINMQCVVEIKMYGEYWDRSNIYRFDLNNPPVFKSAKDHYDCPKGFGCMYRCSHSCDKDWEKSKAEYWKNLVQKAITILTQT